MRHQWAASGTRWQKALARPCHAHNKPPGSPCYGPPDYPGEAVCQARLGAKEKP